MLISENIHIISKQTKEAILQKDDFYILNIVKKAIDSGINLFDLNVGPAKGDLKGSIKYLAELMQSKYSVNFSFDTSNIDEMRSGFLSANSPSDCFLNSICDDEINMLDRLQIASDYKSNLIALAFNPANGISRDSNTRLELLFNIIERANESGIENTKIYADPLVLPVSVAQESSNTVLECIRMFKESFSPEVNTIIGLSNISNGSPVEVRPLINRVFLALAMGSGLNSAIIDSNDTETIKIYNIIKNNDATKLVPLSVESLYFALYNTQNEFLSLNEIEFDKNSKIQRNIIKTANILLNNEIYSHSYYEK